MPYGDGTGRFGRGPFTGRGMGFCAGYDRPGYANRAMGRRFGGGRRLGGFGYGHPFGYGVAQPYYYEELNEKVALENQVEALEMQLKALKERLDVVSKGEAK